MNQKDRDSFPYLSTWVTQIPIAKHAHTSNFEKTIFYFSGLFTLSKQTFCVLEYSVHNFKRQSFTSGVHIIQMWINVVKPAKTILSATSASPTVYISKVYIDICIEDV